MTTDCHLSVQQSRQKCCTQTITIPDEALGKHRQKHTWGTPAWFDAYARRTTVERSFGGLKRDDVGMLQSGWTRQVGLVKLKRPRFDAAPV